MKKIIILNIVVVICFLQSNSQTYFDISKEKPCSDCEIYTADLNSLKHYKLSEIKPIFDSIANSGIQFNYPQGGCQNRAQIMSTLLSKKFNIQYCRVWLFPPADLYDGDNRKLEIYDKNQLTDNNIIQWNYHVAPCVLVDNDGKIDTLIIDPALDKTKPLKLIDWLKSISNSDISKYTFLSSEWYFFETNNNKKISGKFYKFQVDNRYWTDNYRNLTMEKGLAINDMAIYVLSKYILPLRQTNNKLDSTDLTNLKKVFGNVDALTYLFSYQTSYQGRSVSDNIILRSLQEAYPELMTDAMKYYFDRLNFWTKEVRFLR